MSYIPLRVFIRRDCAVRSDERACAKAREFQSVGMTNIGLPNVGNFKTNGGRPPFCGGVSSIAANCREAKNRFSKAVI